MPQERKSGQEAFMNQAHEAATDRLALPGETPAPAFSSNAIYLARTAQINTLTLSQMADQKASILIGTTFVVFSLVVTKLIGSDFTWPIVCLSATAFVSSFCAVFAVLPSSRGPAALDDRSNILFFGTFAGLEEERWLEILLRDFQDDEAVLRIMLRDVHQNGQVLYRRKYRFLSYAYRAFLGGLAITLLAYLADMVFGLGPIAL